MDEFPAQIDKPTGYTFGKNMRASISLTWLLVNNQSMVNIFPAQISLLIYTKLVNITSYVPKEASGISRTNWIGPILNYRWVSQLG